MTTSSQDPSQANSAPAPSAATGESQAGPTGRPEGAHYPKGASFDATWERMAAAGESIHGEADLVTGFSPTRVLDAGCGTGRVAIELAARGMGAAGVDRDDDLLGVARDKAPELEWYLANLDSFELGDIEPFDLVVAAGNVMIFCDPGTHAQVVANCAAALLPGGRLITGFQLKPGGYHTAILDEHAAAAGMTLEHRWSTWDAQEFLPGSDFVVSVHQLA